MRKLQLTALAAVCFLVGRSFGNDEKNDLDKLQGHWVMIESTSDGKKTTKNQLKIERIVDGNNYTVTIYREEGELVLDGTIKLDPSKKPKSIDATRTEGPDKGKAMLGIYELADDRQRVCFASPGKERPTEFSSKPGSGHVLTVWQRVKK